MSEKIDLSLVSFEDLYAEMEKRFDHVIFGGLRINSKQESFYLWRYRGDWSMCVGLCTMLGWKITNDLKFQSDIKGLE